MKTTIKEDELAVATGDGPVLRERTQRLSQVRFDKASKFPLLQSYTFIFRKLNSVRESFQALKEVGLC